MYIRLDENNIVREILPDIDPVFPGIPIERRYPADFVAALLHISDDTSVEQNLVYDVESGAFVEAPVQQLPVPADLEEHRMQVLAAISEVCHDVIASGVDVAFEDAVEHFNLSTEDQANISNLFRVVELGGDEYPYQSDGGVCRVYTAAEIVMIYIAAQTHITYHTTYHNALKRYVQTIAADELSNVTYGMELPEMYQVETAEKLAVAQAQMDRIISRITTKED